MAATDAFPESGGKVKKLEEHEISTSPELVID
jgi:hypothetical protein